ncbi:unnamed protein product [Meganyctiphanes norvegica]|uniref:long-chain-fatty-acid--CoA ligase n=1 Tax=Meganyctiphanes norvegica TaxID=48144 RepID=A0AAV2RXW3_MEGNR
MAQPTWALFMTGFTSAEMSPMRSIRREDGWFVKAMPDGQAYPLDSGLAPIFREAGVTTLPAALKYSASKYGSKPCVATRKLIKRETTEKNGKKFEKLQLGEYTWQSYSQIQDMALAAGIGIKAQGVAPGDRIIMFAESRADWFVAAMGCLQQRITVATLYTTLSDTGIVHGINETEAAVVFTSYELLPRVTKLLPECPGVKTLIVMEDQLEGVGDTKNVPKDLTLIPFMELLQPPENLIVSAGNPEPEDVAILMYTSGSTGNPKGVELTHKNILTSVIGFSVQTDVGPDDRYLAFLPLAHIMELATEVSLVSLGASILYSSPLTMSSAGPKIMKGTEGDAKVARPTIMNTVPLVLDRIIKGISAKVDKQGWLKATLFNKAVKNKARLSSIPFTSFILDRMMFNQVKAELGGQLRRMLCGGAPLSPETHKIIKAIFGVTLQVGYASTETSSSTTGMDMDDDRIGHCGAPILSVMMRLIDWEEGNYKITDTPRPRGEVVVAGPSVCKGYFKLPQENEANFVDEFGQRCFRTGDIGEIDETGAIRIIDRKKDLVKLKHGEYVSLGNAESKLKTLPFVENICVFANSSKGSTVAVIVPSPERLRKLTSEIGIREDDSDENLCADARVKELVLQNLNAHGKKHGLNRWEIPADVSLSLEQWTPDSGLVTAALKIRRKQIGNFYQNMVLEMYSRID